jgi:hypothetical protein
MTTELEQLLSMLKTTGTRHMVVQDMDDVEQRTVTIENLFVDINTRIDVVFQFRRDSLDRVWARRG